MYDFFDVEDVGILFLFLWKGGEGYNFVFYVNYVFIVLFML